MGWNECNETIAVEKVTTILTAPFGIIKPRFQRGAPQLANA
jgi:hypothetical protein